MSGGRPLAFLLLFAQAAAASAQVAPNRATLYLSPTDVTDARALWVNPAGLGLFQEASLHLDLTVGDPGAGGRLRQLTAGFNSRGLSFGYQRDMFAGGVRGHTYRLGLAAGQGGLAFGAAAALYRGGTSATGWDIGVLYKPAPALALGGVIENIGQPTVRGSTLPATYVPGATVRIAGAAAASLLGRFTSAGAAGYALGVRAGIREGTAAPVRLLARVDTDRGLRRTAFTFGLSVGGADLLGVVGTTPGDAGRLDALSVYGVSLRRAR